MIELERQPERLLDPRCDCALLTCLGVAIDQLATAIPRERIVEATFSPLVKVSMLRAGHAPSYAGFDKVPVRFDDVRASVVYASGVLHTDRDVSFSIHKGRVAKMSFYGHWLEALAHLDTIAKLHGAFGAPDRCLRLEADGDLLAYDSYYGAARKWVRWLAAVARPAAVMLGDGADAVREGERGGLSRKLIIAGAN